MAKRFFWIDLEMTGLDDIADAILEVAVVITDLNLKPLEEFHRVVFQPPHVLERMNSWCKKTHGDSGLTAAIATGAPLSQIETELIEFTRRHFDSKERIVLAGNSVGNDKRFIDRHMPEFAKMLHYRLIDVSSFKEIFREKFHLGFDKKNAHRATDDIYESIRELGFYLSFVTIPQPNSPGTP
jgi:oligoribonuclease